MKNKKLLGNGILLLTALIWGTAFVFQRMGMEDIGPFTFSAARMALAAAAVGLAAFLPRRSGKPESPEKSGAAAGQSRWSTAAGGLCCGLFLAGGTIFQQMGIVYTPAGKAGFITAMYILLVPVLAFVLFRRKNTWLVWLAVLLGVAGMYLLCITEEFRLSRGDSLVCVCALFFSGHILCCDHFVRRGDPLRISAIQFAVTAAISAVCAALFERPEPGQFAAAWLPIVYCGIVSGGIGYTLQLIGQRYTEPATASLLMSMESVFAVLAGALLLGERMTARELAGCAVLFAAIVLVQLPAKRKTPPAEK